ncbi:hypothetical protein PF005_g31888 [Phytophthora fragariae]|uniref:RxLR effector protein n=1 Tax=Phytophthora fragariae TaxID=53985 RepID=A0A6A3V6Y9_9STRA|nr:hypothetical protein PF003_g7414 [Phytophthora fragariae]KAE9159860.1 hypothetical protein PF005_g31888 [Phytophthora fragariae]KAE9165666.1 hypothetical protein PF004_g29421 [Phytophthora fragariae]
MVFFGTNAGVASLISLLIMLCAALTARSNSKVPPSSSFPPTLQAHCNMVCSK